MEIFETKTTSPSDLENLRISALISHLKGNGIHIDRYYPSESPEKFRDDTIIGRLIAQHGENILPVIMVNGFAMITGRYPLNEEIRQILNIPRHLIEEKNEGCCCIQGCCHEEKKR
ncbi:MAG: arsenic metallochaperone ArsD family protein [Methanocalculaceae archaeon]|jgi:hypothetical protein|nr:arsenic metallochaperone ArsD family protein [Methanocalculaceae archaeon]